VLVVHDPGDWFTVTLAALAAQDYPALRVLVVDAGSSASAGVSERVTAAMPDAVVHRLDGNPGFGAAANEVLDRPAIAAGVEYLLFCHDDVAPARRATQALVDAAQATGAGVVGPKLVSWDDPRRLRQFGCLVDKAGVAIPVVEPGELDQGQHDGLRAVCEVPGAFTLVHAGLFAAIGGFDEAIDRLGDDLSLCWRARLAGAPVVVTAAARVRHREVLAARLAPAERERLSSRHRLRVVLTSYRWWYLVRLLPQLALWSVATVALALVRLRPGHARAVVGAWWWNVCRPRSLWRARRHVGRFRRTSDREVRRLQVPGLVHPMVLLQRAGVGTGTRRRAVRDRLDAWCAGWTRGGAAVLLVLAGVLLMGSRHLLTRGVPGVGDFAPFGAPRDLVGQWFGTWRPTGLGVDAPAPTALGVFGGLGALLRGHDGLLRLACTVALIPVGVVGAVRLLRPTGSRWAPVAAAVAYAAVPVPYVALADGRWAPLAVYAAAPFLLGGLVRASGVAPFGSSSLMRDILHLAIVGGLLALAVPAAALVVLFLAVGLAVGCLLALDLRGALRVVLAGLGGTVAAAALQLPWAVDAARSWRVPGSWAAGLRAPVEVDAGGLLALGSGAVASAPWTWGLAAAAAVPMVVGRSWRASWAVRAWVLACGGWVTAAAAAGGWASGWGLGLPDPALALVCTGAALALAAGIGMAALEQDVVGRSRRLGFRRLVVVLGWVGLVAATVPVLRASLDGYWHLPRGDFGEVLAFVDHPPSGPPARILWLGDPAALPAPGWAFGSGPEAATADGATMGFAVTDGLPTLPARWPQRRGPVADRIDRAVQLALTQQTARLGGQLARSGIDYVVVPQRRAPSPVTAPEVPAPPGLIEALAGQLDLERVDVDPAVVVYRNLAPISACDRRGGPCYGGPASDRAGTGHRLLLVGQAVLWLGAVAAAIGLRRRAGAVRLPATAERSERAQRSEPGPAPPEPTLPEPAPSEPEPVAAGVDDRPSGANGGATTTRRTVRRRRSVKIKAKESEPPPEVVESVKVIR